MHFTSIHYQGVQPGIRLIILGAVHGNETCGTQAILRIVNEINAGRIDIAAGCVTFVPVTNPLAYAKRQRTGDRNLNRNLSPTETPEEFEDTVANWLCPLLQQHDALLDLHSFHTAGMPFALIGPRNNTGPLEPFSHEDKEAALACRLGVSRVVDGWLETYAKGTARRKMATEHLKDLQLERHLTDASYGIGTTEYMRTVGGWGITLECGQHDDPQAPEVAYRAILNTLVHLGIVSGEPVDAMPMQALQLYEVVDKYHPDDRLSRNWASFESIQAGDLIGTRADGTTLNAENDGFIVFPNPKAEPGSEWFYLARLTDRFSSS